MTRPASACRFVVPPPGCHPSGAFRCLPLDRPGSPTRTLFTEPVGVENAPMEPQASPSNHGTAAADAAAAGGGLHYIDVSGGVRSHDLPGGAHPLQPRAAWTRRRTAPRAAAKRPPPSPLPAPPSAALAAPRPCCEVQPRAVLRALTQRAEAPPAGLSSALLSLSAFLPAVPAAGGPVVQSDIAGMSLVRDGACAARASPPPLGAPAVRGAPIPHSAAPRKKSSRRHAEAVTPPTLSRYIFTTTDGRTRRTIGGRRQLRPQAASPPARQARGAIVITNSSERREPLVHLRDDDRVDDVVRALAAGDCLVVVGVRCRKPLLRQGDGYARPHSPHPCLCRAS